MSSTPNSYTDPTASTLVQTVAANVRAEAGRRGYTQKSLGVALRQAQSTVSNKWRGSRAWRLEDLEDISDVLEVPITTLIARPEGFEPPTFCEGVTPLPLTTTDVPEHDTLAPVIIGPWGQPNTEGQAAVETR